ncbi:sugar phosphate isomerase/epimerase family protein [Pelagibacterium luteolum]|uniref:Sugar phosphate isomerase/epimerase n=1 Tax=Pelagibacterium luteolum TaxID=440168 RepID=A0A1G7XW96_9HYPH|nr:sugar phosphate isomerase/epimerase family protein [Pelagibacterium luteolum]SDG88286.1 Sugar phosphate isomerase/epimerase [Pelagibacterium luteolum]
MMRPRAAISNIAWPAEADDEALDLAVTLGFSGIELAPAKVFGPPDTADPDAVERYREALQARGLTVPALQAILFGVADAHLFGSPEARERLAVRLARVAEIAGALGAGACVFGSPGLRDPGDRPAEDAMAIAMEFFAEMAPRFDANDTTLAFEANATIYDCRFITHTHEAMRLVSEVDRKGFGLQLDLGTVFANREDTDTLIAAARLAAHCHASEPHLVPLGSGGHDHARAGDALRQAGYDGWISVEMKATPDWQTAMRAAAHVLDRHYGAGGS